LAFDHENIGDKFYEPWNIAWLSQLNDLHVAAANEKARHFCRAFLIVEL
jgi:hypothetical protein